MDKYFIITIDTEGDNIWKRVTTQNGMRNIAVENAKYIERFQRLCDKYGFIPTYLVNYEMASAESFVSLAKDWVREGKCEIGMHMHAWNTPPIYDLPFNRKGHNPFAGEYPRKILFQKMQVMTEVLEKTFGVRPISHRGGRWYIDAWYIEALRQLGYIVDCSVTPGVSWSNAIGNTRYGSDYSDFKDCVCRIDGKRVIRDNGKEKSEKMLEIPPTIMLSPIIERMKKMLRYPDRAKDICRERIWLRPNGMNLDNMLYIVEKTKDREYIEFMLHSSELMPGGSPTFKNAQSIEKLYRDLEVLFDRISQTRTGISLSGYAKLWNENRI